MRKFPLPLLALALLLPRPAFADTACKMTPLASLAVEMHGQRKLRPVVKANINGTAALLLFDTGSFMSMLFTASAPKYSLTSEPTPAGMTFTSAGQKFEASLARAQSLELSGLARNDVDVAITASSMSAEIDGLLGIPDMGDGMIEIDLPNRVIRFFSPCDLGNPVYWAKPADVQTIAIEPMTVDAPRIFGAIKVNDTNIRALFDTGTPTSVLTAAAAARAGVTPDTPGVAQHGFSGGVGGGALKTWTAQFTSMALDHESLPNPKLDFVEKPNASADMLIGADFFLTHRVLVSRRTSRLYFTYSGGALFGTEPAKN